MKAPLQCSVQSWAPFSEGSLISRIYDDLDKTSTIANVKIVFALIDPSHTNVLNMGRPRVKFMLQMLGNTEVLLGPC